MRRIARRRPSQITGREKKPISKSTKNRTCEKRSGAYAAHRLKLKRSVLAVPDGYLCVYPRLTFVYTLVYTLV